MFEIIAEPLNNVDVRVDLVFVHGLSDDWRSTWKKDGQDGVSWIQDFITSDIPHARIFACGRNILDGSRTYQPFPIDGLQEYERNRYSQKRPVIFLAHSLGGLILQAFLQECNPLLRNSTKGIIFFGTPNLSWQENQRINFAAAVRALGRTVNSDYLSNLGLISDKFAAWVVDQHFAGRMICFYERLPVTGNIIVVEKGSRFLPRCDSRGLDANHMDMTKFQSRSSANYQTVLQSLRSMYCHADEGMRVLLRHSLQPNSHGRLINLPATPDGCEEFMASTQGSVIIRDIGRLALIAEDQGHYQKAESRYRAAIDSLLLRNNCSLEVINLGRLAIRFAERGFEDGTEEDFEQIARSFQTMGSAGSDDTAVLFCLHKWACLLCNRGRYKHAELYSRCCLEARIRITGKGSASTLLAAANLVWCLVLQKRHQEGYNILRDALEHQDLALSYSCSEIPLLRVLVQLELASGSHELAESLSSDILRKSIRVYGFGHPFTLSCMSDLAAVLARRGHLSRAEALSRRALNGLEHALGNDHPDCLKTACRLANNICFQQRYDDATVRHKKILKKQQMRIGNEHPDTLLTMRSLGIDFALQRCWKDAEIILDETFQGLKACLGPEDTHTTETEDALRNVRELQDRKEHPQTLLEVFRPQSGLVSYRSLTYARSPSCFHTSVEDEVLQAVTEKDEQRVVEILAGDRIGPTVSGRALRESAATSQEPLVRHLLTCKVPLNRQSGYHGTVLQAAALAGNEAIVKLLLEYKIDMYVVGGLLGNALRAAVFGRKEAILRLLLQAIAPGRLSQDVLNSSLQLALRLEDSAMIDLLLGAGADINAEDSLFGSPLQQAAFYGQEKIMTIQLRSADINKRGGIFGSPLQAALETQNEAAVNHLLEAGATILSSPRTSFPKGHISTHEREELAKILLKRLAYSLPHRSLSVDFGLWDPIQTPKQPVVSWTPTVGFRNNSSSHLQKPVPPEEIPRPKRVSTMKRLLLDRKSGSTTDVSKQKPPILNPSTKKKRSIQSLRRKFSGLT